MKDKINTKALTEKEKKGLKIFCAGIILTIIGFSMLILMDDKIWGASLILFGALLFLIVMASSHLLYEQALYERAAKKIKHQGLWSTIKKEKTEIGLVLIFLIIGILLAQFLE